MATRIEDYALLGNCRTAALVSREGSIDWLCFPRFDSSPCFAALLGTPENGRWSLRPSGTIHEVSRGYEEGTLILETIFRTDTGVAKLIDFMPTTTAHSSVARMVVGIEGSVDFEMELIIRFGYGRIVPWLEQHGEGCYTAVAGPDMLVLRSTTPLVSHDQHSHAEFTVHAGQRKVFSLSHQPSHEHVGDEYDFGSALASTNHFWREFSDRCPDVGPWSALVKRSLITLKALTYQPTGGIVAAVTTSLPEQLGGERNWDYRFCWLRDATMTLLAFMNLGYFDEAASWRNWLSRSVAGTPAQMQIMYGLAGERHLPEFEVPWLAGYENSRPVRVGNAAATQTQLDIYGEVADAMVQAIRGHLSPHPRIEAIAQVIVPFLEQAWKKPDEGIWEIRAEPQHFVHSKVMAWVAFDRIASVASTMSNGGRFAQNCRRIANEIRAEVCEKGYDRERNTFVQHYGSTALDASLLHIVLTGFLPPNDPRVVGTVAAIEQRLMRDGLLLRYETETGVDGLPPGEGVFLACSFWLADVYVLQGRYAEAQTLFERLTALCNDVGLLSEQYDPQQQRMLGNFPQAFSHVGIIDTALNLHRRGQAPAVDRAQI